jgi:predicted alpha/beta-fold hydrolase
MFYLTDILTPTKILLAKNDPMLARGNYEDLLQANPRLDWQIEEEGGHCGFWGVKAAVWNPNQINLD